MNIQLALIVGLINAVISAIGKVLLKKGLQSYHPSVIFGLETIFGLIFWTSFAIIYGVNLANVLNIIPIVLISAILSEAYVFYVYSKGEISIVVPAFSTYSLFTIIFSVLINNETLTNFQLLSALVIIVGVITLSIKPKDINKKIKDHLASVAWGLSGAVAVGFSDTISKATIDQVDAATFLFALGIMQLIIAVLYLRFAKRKFTEILNIFADYKTNVATLLGTSLIAFGMIFFWLTFENTLASIASPITATVSLFVVVLARIFLKEKLTLPKILGACLISLGMFGLGF